ncbi:MAG TPA: TetR-like C-terminal domain-containing protein [Coleofasciculaceae cyanobacterium]|jgi:hypothetical protein
MRMLNSAIYGFFTMEQAGLLSLDRPTDAIYEVILDVLIVAIEHVFLDIV